MKKLLVIILLNIYITLPALANTQSITIHEAYQLCIEKNIKLKSKIKQLDELQEELKAANALKNPEFQSNFLIGKVKVGNSSQFGLAFPIEIAKRSARKNLVKAKIKTLNNEIEKEKHTLTMNLYRSYIRTLYLKSLLKIEQDKEKSYLRIQEHINNNNTDKQDIKINSQKQKIVINNIKMQIFNEELEFNKLLNIENSDIHYNTAEVGIVDENLNVYKMKNYSYQELLDLALTHSYSLLLYNNQIDIEKSNLTLQKRKRIPDLTIAGGYAFESKYNSIGNNSSGAFVGANATLPMFYFYNPEIREARIRIERTKLNKKAYEQELKFVLLQDYTKINTLQDNIKIYQEIIADSQKTLEKHCNEYRLKKMPVVNLIFVEEQYYNLLEIYMKEVLDLYLTFLDLTDNIGYDIYNKMILFENP